MKSYLKDSKTYISFALEKLTNFVPCCKMVFIQMNTWMAEEDSEPWKGQYYDFYVHGDTLLLLSGYL